LIILCNILDTKTKYLSIKSHNIKNIQTKDEQFFPLVRKENIIFGFYNITVFILCILPVLYNIKDNDSLKKKNLSEHSLETIILSPGNLQETNNQFSTPMKINDINNNSSTALNNQSTTADINIQNYQSYSELKQNLNPEFNKTNDNKTNELKEKDSMISNLKDKLLMINTQKTLSDQQRSNLEAEQILRKTETESLIINIQEKDLMISTLTDELLIHKKQYLINIY
jgi:hypothetical protein